MDRPKWLEDLREKYEDDNCYPVGSNRDEKLFLAHIDELRDMVAHLYKWSTPKRRDIGDDPWSPEIIAVPREELDEARASAYDLWNRQEPPEVK